MGEVTAYYIPEDQETLAGRGEALADLFSTVEFKGWQPILGEPPPVAERTRRRLTSSWSRRKRWSAQVLVALPTLES